MHQEEVQVASERAQVKPAATEQVITPAPKPTSSKRTRKSASTDPIVGAGMAAAFEATTTAPKSRRDLQPDGTRVTGAESKAARMARQASEGKGERAPRQTRVKATCSVEGCTNAVHAKGICPQHYNAARSVRAKAAREAVNAEAQAQDANAAPQRPSRSKA